LTVSHPDERFAPVYADALSRIQKAGRSISPMDLLIATAAIVADAELVTGNRKHFDAVPNLRLLTYR
jgi:predicted nucleic acid-binding protein